MPDETPPCRLVRLGRVPFEEARRRQRRAHDLLKSYVTGDGSGPPPSEVLFRCTHDPVITLGTGGSEANVATPPEELARLGLAVVRAERGGDVTYHGPEQEILYPVLDLGRRRRDVGWYVRSLEEVVIHALGAFRVRGEREAGRPGVWVARPDGPPRKIASVGVKLSRWCTYHGIALNVGDARAGFAHVIPCGLAGVRVTSLEEESGVAADRDAVGVQLETSFSRTFGISLSPVSSE